MRVFHLTYIFAHDNISKTFLPLYITNMQSSMIHRRGGLCLVYPMAYERLSWQDPACSQSPHASLKILSRTSLLQLQKRPKKQQWLHAEARRLGDDDDKQWCTGPWLTMLTVLQQGHQVKQGHEGHIEALIVQRGVLWELSVPTLLPLPPAVWRGIAQNAVKEGASNCRVDGTDLWS